MFWTRRHLSDQELVLAADDELSARRLQRAHRHLASCSTCQVRMGIIQRTLAELTRACRDREHPRLPPSGAARARLKIQLTRLSGEHGASPISSYLQRVVMKQRWLYAFGVVVLAASGIFLYARSAQQTSHVIGETSRVFLLPVARLTPRATRPVTLSELCGSTRHGVAATIPTSVHQEVFQSYGADYRRAAEYELDHLVTPELGGASDARNLWPQPYSRTPWNAYVKDELERLFHRLACDGEIDLATAQRQMATDWIAAYKQYFKTDKPLRDYAKAPLTARDADFLLSELEEFGVRPPAGHTDGPALMAMLQAAREDSLRQWLPPDARQRYPIVLRGMAATLTVLNSPQ